MENKKNIFKTKIKRVIVFKINKDQDLLEGIYNFCKKIKSTLECYYSLVR
ncbi:MAG: hypothetical protein ACP5H7_02100 [Minisyncoccia bacterium]